MLNSSIVLKLESLLTRSGEINDALSQEGATDDMAKFTQLNKEYAEITPIVNQFKLLQGLEGELSGAKELLKSGDSELIELAKSDISLSEEKIAQLTIDLKLMLLPKDEA
ncbi:MAG: PCRF domain-containing protein, partial [Proteobacteria bacterium]|nr:PCRF domain-containing protein [Pseudomonadota bacterium]